MEIVLILCLTFLMVVVIYWIMPIEKMNAVNNALKSLLQILPISQIIKAFIKEESTSKKE